MTKPKDDNFSDLQTMEESQKPDAAEDTAFVNKLMTLEGCCVALGTNGLPGMRLFRVTGIANVRDCFLARDIPDARKRLVEILGNVIEPVKQSEQLEATQRALAKLASNGKTAAS